MHLKVLCTSLITTLAASASAQTTIADCQPGDVPGGVSSLACQLSGSVGALVAGGGYSVNVYANAGTSWQIFGTDAPVGVSADYLIFGEDGASANAFCCRVDFDADPTDWTRLHVSVNGGASAVDFDGFDDPAGSLPGMSLPTGFSPAPAVADPSTVPASGWRETLAVSVSFLASDTTGVRFDGSDTPGILEMITATEGPDVLVANDGPAWMMGRGGDDQLSAGAQSDLLWGDRYHYSVSLARQYGAPFPCSPTDSDGVDVIQAGGGDDVVRGCAAGDLLSGGPGDDDIYGGDPRVSVAYGAVCQVGTLAPYVPDGNDIIVGGLGVDTIHGCLGADWIVGGVATIVGGVPVCNTTASDVGDFIFGEAGNDVISGCQGNDVIEGGADNDQLSGGQGSDLILGGEGHDDLYGNGGVDFLRTGPGDDDAFGGPGGDFICEVAVNGDSLNGGDGDDLIHVEGGLSSPNGGQDNDRCFPQGNCETGLPQTPVPVECTLF